MLENEDTPLKSTNFLANSFPLYFSKLPPGTSMFSSFSLAKGDKLPFSSVSNETPEAILIQEFWLFNNWIWFLLLLLVLLYSSCLTLNWFAMYPLTS